MTAITVTTHRAIRGFPFFTYCYYFTPIATDILLLKQFLLRAFIVVVIGAQTADRLRPRGLSNWLSCTGRHYSLLHNEQGNSRVQTAAQPLSPDV